MTTLKTKYSPHCKVVSMACTCCWLCVGNDKKPGVSFFLLFRTDLLQSGSLYSCQCIFENPFPGVLICPFPIFMLLSSSIWMESNLFAELLEQSTDCWQLQCYFTISSVLWLRIWSPQSTIQSWCQPLVTINPLIYLSLLWIAVYNSLFLLWGNTATVNKGEAGGPLRCSSLFPVTFLHIQMHVFISPISVMILVSREAHSAWEMGNAVFHSWLQRGCWIKHREFLKIPLAPSGKCFGMSIWKLPPKN